MVMVMITTLNSNLILLILLNSNYIKYAEFTLNSNLILLILTAAFEHYGFDVVFKFQSDSINTSVGGYLETFEFNFKFQSDSINTHPCFVAL